MSKSNDPEWEWRLQLTALVAEVKTNQDNLDKKIDTYIESSQQRVDDLEHVVYGNGSEGLSEQVRNLKGKWAVIYGLIIISLSAVAQAASKEAFAAIFK